MTQKCLERGQTFSGGRRIVVEQFQRANVHDQPSDQTPPGVQQSPAVGSHSAQEQRRRSHYRPGRPVVGDHGRHQVQPTAAATVAPPIATSAAPAAAAAEPPVAHDRGRGLAVGPVLVFGRPPPAAGRERGHAILAAVASAERGHQTTSDRRATDVGHGWQRLGAAAPPAAFRRGHASVAALVRRGRRRLRRPLSEVRKLLPFLSVGKSCTLHT